MQRRMVILLKLIMRNEKVVSTLKLEDILRLYLISIDGKCAFSENNIGYSLASIQSIDLCA